jgi:hypothetical protein
MVFIVLTHGLLILYNLIIISFDQTSLTKNVIFLDFVILFCHLLRDIVSYLYFKKHYMRFITVIFLLLSLSISVMAQKKLTISGYLKDASSGEDLIGASVFIKETMKGTTANTYGFFSFSLDPGEYTLVASYVGFDTYEQKISLTEDVRININLTPTAIEMEGVTVTGEKSTNTESTEMGRATIDIEKVKSLPAFMGEADPMKTIQLLPGVLAAGEGNSGFYVRGGGPDQNLILLDEAVVYNASHLFGFFSVFNADAVKNIELYKGTMPSNFGGRLASVVDVTMKDGNNQKFEVDGGVGLIASRLTVQGPIKKNKASFLVSGRRTYIDVVSRPLIKESSPFKGSGYYFYDLNAKLNYKFSDKDRVYLSGYLGKDKFYFNDREAGFEAEIPWGNATATARWNHLYSDKLFSNLSLIYSKYDFSFGAIQDQFEFKLFSGIQDYNAKLDYHWFPANRHKVKFGANYVYHTFIPSNATARSGEVTFNTGDIVKLFGHEGAVYFSDDFDVTEKFRLNVGARYSGFAHMGPFTRYLKDPTTGQNSDTIVYNRGDVVKFYHGIEPRISMRYAINKTSSVKAAYTHNLQYIHLASLSTVSLPTDVWVPVTDRTKPQIGDQYSVGYFKNFKQDMYEASVEVYYKTMKNQVEYREGAQPDDDVRDNIDNNFVFGKGWSYGAEFFLKKRHGDFNGWIGYTLAWTKRQFDDINLGEVFYAKFDRRNDVSVALTYDYKKWTFGLVFIYATGNAITLPNSWYIIDNTITYEYAARNSIRMIPYHRLDLSATYHFKKREKFSSELNISVYNVYSRLNPYFLYINTEGDPYNGSLTIKAKQVSLFPILPSVTYNFKF